MVININKLINLQQIINDSRFSFHIQVLWQNYYFTYNIKLVHKLLVKLNILFLSPIVILVHYGSGKNINELKVTNARE